MIRDRFSDRLGLDSGRDPVLRCDRESPRSRDRWPTNRPRQPRKKLYIETVGCQMNLLDSELVVAKLRERRLRADRRHQPGRHDPLQHVLGPAARRGQDLQRARADQAAQGAEARACRSACWAAWRRRTRSRSSGGHRTSTWSSARASSRGCRELLDAGRGARRRRRSPSACRATPARSRSITASFESYDADREPAMRPSPFQAFVRVMMGCDKFCTYCIVPSVRGPEQSRPPGGDPRRGPAARRPGGQGDHAARPDRQQLPVPRARRPRSTGSPTCSRGSTTSPAIERIKFITNFPNDMTDDLLQAVRDLPKVCPIPPRPRAERLRRGPEADEADVHGRVLRGDAGADPRDDSRRRGLERLHRRLLRRGRGVVRADGRPGRAVSVQEQLHLQVQPAARGPRPTRFIADDVPEAVKKRRNNELLAFQTAISLEDNRRLDRPRRSRCWSRGRARSTARRDGWEGVDQLTGRTACDRIVVFDGPERLIGQFVQVVVEDASAVDPLRPGGDIRADRDSGVKGMTYDGRLARRPGELLDRLGWDRRAPGARAERAREPGFRANGRVRAGPAPIRGRSPPGRSGTAIACRTACGPGCCSPTASIGGGPLIHPISAIGPMIPFARVPDLIVQPESWFELGNPNVETICIDLAYRLPGGGYPIFTSGDDAVGEPAHGSSPGASRSGSSSCCARGAGNTGSTRASRDLGDPWQSHRRTRPQPAAARPAPRRSPTACPACMQPGADERKIAASLGLSRGDVESIFRHLQHVEPDLAGFDPTVLPRTSGVAVAIVARHRGMLEHSRDDERRAGS